MTKIANKDQLNELRLLPGYPYTGLSTKLVQLCLKEDLQIDIEYELLGRTLKQDRNSYTKRNGNQLGITKQIIHFGAKAPNYQSILYYKSHYFRKDEYVKELQNDIDVLNLGIITQKRIGFCVLVYALLSTLVIIINMITAPKVMIKNFLLLLSLTGVVFAPAKCQMELDDDIPLYRGGHAHHSQTPEPEERDGQVTLPHTGYHMRADSDDLYGSLDEDTDSASLKKPWTGNIFLRAFSVIKHCLVFLVVCLGLSYSFGFARQRYFRGFFRPNCRDQMVQSENPHAHQESQANVPCNRVIGIAPSSIQAGKVSHKPNHGLERLDNSDPAFL